MFGRATATVVSMTLTCRVNTAVAYTLCFTKNRKTDLEFAIPADYLRFFSVTYCCCLRFTRFTDLRDLVRSVTMRGQKLLGQNRAEQTQEEKATNNKDDNKNEKKIYRYIRQKWTVLRILTKANEQSVRVGST